MSETPSEPKFCPHLMVARAVLNGGTGMCLQEKCAMWRTWETHIAWGCRENIEDKPDVVEYHNITGYCGLAGRP